MSLIQTTAPTDEPVSMDEIRSHLHLDIGQEDVRLGALISVARQYAETFTRRQFCTATWTLKLDTFYAAFIDPFYTSSLSFPSFSASKIKIPRPPVQSLTSIQYVDSAGNTQTLASSGYQFVNDPDGPFVMPSYSNYWPATRYQPEAVTITYQAGYGAVGAVPKTLKQAMLMLIEHWYSNRGVVASAPGQNMVEVPKGVDELLYMNRAWAFE